MKKVVAKFSEKEMAETREKYAKFKRKFGFGPDENTRQDRLRREREKKI